MELIEIFEVGSLKWAICITMKDIAESINDQFKFNTGYSENITWLKYKLKVMNSNMEMDAHVIEARVDEESKSIIFDLSKDIFVFKPTKIIEIEDEVLDIIFRNKGFILSLDYNVDFRGVYTEMKLKSKEPTKKKSKKEK